MQDTVSIRGTREGLTITIGDSEWPHVLDDLSRHLKMQGAFFRGGRVALEARDRGIGQDQLRELCALLEQYDMILRTVVASNSFTQSSCQALGLRLVATESEAGDATQASRVPPQPAPQSGPQPQRSSPLEGSKGVLVRHVVRSGQVLRHSGHVVILGDVHAGGEVVAGGDIIVWGRLHGLAHAGSMGDESAVICALQMTPMLLRIAKLMGRPEEGGDSHSAGAEVAYVRDDMIIVETWDRASRGMR